MTNILNQFTFFWIKVICFKLDFKNIFQVLPPFMSFHKTV